MKFYTLGRRTFSAIDNCYPCWRPGQAHHWRFVASTAGFRPRSL